MYTRGRSGESIDRSSRAQSAILGLVLLIGVVATASVGILIIAADTTEDLEQQTENERVEQSFVELSQKMATTATTGDTTKVVGFAAGEYGAIAKTNTGSINITGDGLDVNIPIGAIEYQGDDGTVIAYQAGGVFRETGNETRVVSSPPIQYDTGEGVNDDTLNFPITEVASDTEIGSDEVTISHENTTTQGNTLVEDSTVEIAITSEYCRGWENYFWQETRDAGNAIQEKCHEGNEDEVIVELGLENGEFVLDRGGASIHEEGHYDDFIHSQIENVEYIDDPIVIDDLINDLITEASNSNEYENLSGSEYNNLDDGKYYIEGINSSDEFTFNLTDGSATVIVNGDINLGDIEVIGNNELKIYTNADKMTIGGDVYHESKDGSGARYIQTFGKSNMTIDGSPNEGGYYEGLIYAISEENHKWGDDIQQANPDSECQAFVQANGVEIDGAVVAYGVCAHSSGQGGIKDNDEFHDYSIDLFPDDHILSPDVYYLNIPEHKVNVE